MSSFEQELEEKCARDIKDINNYDITNSIAKIVERIYFDKHRIAYLEEENKKLKEQCKNNDLSDMRNKLKKAKEDLYRGFPISKEEENSIKKWIENHEDGECKHFGDSYAKISGRRYRYKFIPTSLGTIGIITCFCGENFEFRSL